MPRRRVRVVDVRLQIGPAGDVPASRGHQLLNAREELWIVLLDPAVEQRFVVVEDEAAMRLAEAGGDAEGGDGLSDTVLPMPQPDRSIWALQTR